MNQIHQLENDTLNFQKEILDFSNFINETLLEAENEIRLIPKNISETILATDITSQFTDIIQVLKKTYKNHVNFQNSGNFWY